MGGSSLGRPQDHYQPANKVTSPGRIQADAPRCLPPVHVFWHMEANAVLFPQLCLTLGWLLSIQNLRGILA